MRPIIVNSPLIRPIKSGIQTQMRRVVKPDAPYTPTDEGLAKLWASGRLDCHYGRQGDLLWVRERWRTLKRYDQWRPNSIIEWAKDKQISTPIPIWYSNDETIGWQQGDVPGEWRNSRHMPREFSRITLGITSIRMERLNSISDADCISEGIAWTPGQQISPVEVFANLWESNYGHDWHWETNPYVWVISFNLRSKK